MELYIQDHANCLKQVFVTFPVEEMESLFNKSIQTLAKKADIPGYRKGKAPADIIAKKYPVPLLESIKENALAKAMLEVSKKGIDIFSEPKFYALSTIQRNLPMSFYIAFESVPRILNKIDESKIKISYDHFILDDKAINKAVENKTNIMKSSTGSVKENNIILAELDGKLDKALKEVSIQIPMDSPFIGKKKGDEISIEPVDLGSTLTLYIDTLHFPAKAIIKEVRSVISSEKLTDKDIKESTNFETVDELKNNIKEELERAMDQINTDSKRKALIEYLGKHLKVELPRSIYLESCKQMTTKFLSDELSHLTNDLKDGIKDKSFNKTFSSLPEKAYTDIKYIIYLDEYIKNNSISFEKDIYDAYLSSIGREHGLSLQDTEKRLSNDEKAYYAREATRETALRDLESKITFEVKEEKPISSLDK